MHPRVRIRWAYALLTAAVVAVLAAPWALAHLQIDAPVVDLTELSREAEFVFIGEVTAVEYRNSESVPETAADGSVLLDKQGNPVLRDGSDLPHTFVTFKIETILKGRKAGNEDSITLRFLGGREPEDILVEEDGEMVPAAQFLHPVNDPLFDVGDRDLLFVTGNGNRACPLVNLEEGRMRLINRDPAKQGENQVYTERGQEIRLVTDREHAIGCRPPVQYLAGGRTFALEDVMHNDIGGVDFGRVDSELVSDGDSAGEGTAEPDNVPGEPFLESDVIPLVSRTIREVNTREQLANLPPVVDADPTAPFTIAPATEVRPQPEPESQPEAERPWLDRLTTEQREAIRLQEAEEAAMFEASGGDPTLTPLVPQK